VARRRGLRDDPRSTLPHRRCSSRGGYPSAESWSYAGKTEYEYRSVPTSSLASEATALRCCRCCRCTCRGCSSPPADCGDCWQDRQQKGNRRCTRGADRARATCVVLVRRSRRRRAPGCPSRAARCASGSGGPVATGPPSTAASGRCRGDGAAEHTGLPNTGASLLASPTNGPGARPLSNRRIFDGSSHSSACHPLPLRGSYATSRQRTRPTG